MDAEQVSRYREEYRALSESAAKLVELGDITGSGSKVVKMCVVMQNMLDVYEALGRLEESIRDVLGVKNETENLQGTGTRIEMGGTG